MLLALTLPTSRPSRQSLHRAAVSRILQKNETRPIPLAEVHQLAFRGRRSNKSSVACLTETMVTHGRNPNHTLC